MNSLRRAPGKARGLPLWITIAFFSAVQILLVAGVVGYVTWRDHTRAMRELAGKIRDQVAQRIVDHLSVFLATPRMINATSAAAARAGGLDVRDPAELQRYFLEQVRIHDSVTSIYFGNTRGGIAGAGREGPAGNLYFTESPMFGSGSFRKYTVEATGAKGRLLQEVPGFDARQRPWYSRAAERDTPAWSGPYVLVTAQAATLSASLPLRDATGALQGVFSVDVFLPHFSAFLSTLDLGTTGEAFVMDLEGVLIASSGAATPRTGQPATQSPVPVVARAAAELTAREGSLAGVDAPEPLIIEVDGMRYLGQACPFLGESGLDWLAVVALPESDYLASIITANRTALLWAALVTLLAVAAAAYISHREARPIAQLARYAEAVELGTLGSPPRVGRTREVRDLVRALQDMGDRLRAALDALHREIQERREAESALRESEGHLKTANQRLHTTLIDLESAQEQLVRRERLAATAELTATVAHRLNNMLAAIMGYSELARETPGLPEGVREDLVALTAQGSEAAALVSQLMRFSQGSSRGSVPVDAASVAREALESFHEVLPPEIRLAADLPSGALPVMADPADLRNVLDNVLANAREAIEGDGALEIKLALEHAPPEERCELCGEIIEGRWASLAVRDTGGGIAPEVWRRLFEPFSTTKTRSWRTGLGMAEVAGILRHHGGHLTLDSASGKGTTVRIFLRPAQ